MISLDEYFASRLPTDGRSRGRKGNLYSRQDSLSQQECRIVDLLKGDFEGEFFEAIFYFLGGRDVFDKDDFL